MIIFGKEIGFDMANKKRYYLDGDGGWFSAANDDITRLFEGMTVTPRKVNFRYIPESIDNSEKAAKLRDKYYKPSYSRDQNTPIEKGLELVSPEFDIIGLGGLSKHITSGLKNSIPKVYKDIGKINTQTSSDLFRQDAKLAFDVINKYFKSTEYKNRLIKKVGEDKANEIHKKLIDKLNTNVKVQLHDGKIVYSDKYGMPVVEHPSTRGLYDAETDIIHLNKSTADGYHTGIHEFGHKSDIKDILKANEDLYIKPSWQNIEKAGKEAGTSKKAMLDKYSYLSNESETRTRFNSVLADMYKQGYPLDYEGFTKYSIDPINKGNTNLSDLINFFDKNTIRRGIENMLGITAPISIGYGINKQN